jgi:hypothetical protein
MNLYLTDAGLMDALESDLLDKENLALLNPYLVGVLICFISLPMFCFLSLRGGD